MPIWILRENTIFSRSKLASCFVYLPCIFMFTMAWSLEGLPEETYEDEEPRFLQTNAILTSNKEGRSTRRKTIKNSYTDWDSYDAVRHARYDLIAEYVIVGNDPFVFRYGRRRTARFWWDSNNQVSVVEAFVHCTIISHYRHLTNTSKLTHMTLILG